MTRTIHIRAVHDQLGAPAFAIAGRVNTSFLPEYARLRVKNGVVVPSEWMEEISIPGQLRCAACAAAEPCGAWDWAALEESGVTPRAPGDTRPRPHDAPGKTLDDHAETLGLSEIDARDPARVTAAFRVHVLAAHPDRGGSGADVPALVAARDALLARKA